MLVVGRKMYTLQRKDIFQVEKNSTVFFSIQQYPSAGFPEIMCRNEMQTNKRFIYHERKKCQDISFSLLKSSVEKFCCLHIEVHTARLFLYSRIREYDQTTLVLIYSEDTDIMVVRGYLCSIIN